MTDFFALLGLPRTAVLDETALQAAWHDKSRAAHPDQPGGSAAAAAEINAAYETLAAPEKRLKHLLDLHAVSWRAIPISEDLMRLFAQLGPALQRAATLARRKKEASSALARALLAPQEMEGREQLEALGTEIGTRQEAIIAALPRGADLDFEQLQASQATLAYLSKWQGQIREALLSLM